MPNNKRIMIGVVIILFSGLALLLDWIKDEKEIATVEYSSLSLNEQPGIIQPESRPSSPTASLEHEQKVLQQRQQFIQQRDVLYMQLANISNHLSQGKKPDLREVSSMLETQRQLVKVKVISVPEASATIQFLQKILPEMEIELAREIKLIEQ